MRPATIITTLFALLSAVSALPVTDPVAQQKQSSAISRSTHSDLHASSNWLYRRKTATEKKEAKEKKMADKKQKARKNLQEDKKKAKVTFSKDLIKKFDDLGLHGKQRKAAKNYHKNIVKAEMKNKPGAVKAKITHEAHDVGSVDPKNHITAMYYDKSGQELKSQYKDLKTGQVQQGIQHHVYPEDHPKFKEPKSWTKAVTDSKAKKAAEAKAAKEAADRAAKKEAAERKAVKNKAYQEQVVEKKAAGKKANRGG